MVASFPLPFKTLTKLYSDAIDAIFFFSSGLASFLLTLWMQKKRVFLHKGNLKRFCLLLGGASQRSTVGPQFLPAVNSV